MAVLLLEIASINTADAALFSNDEKHAIRIDVPGLGLEGPYLFDVNNCGPYLGDVNADGTIDVVVSPWGTTQGHCQPPERYIWIFENHKGMFSDKPEKSIRIDHVENCMIGDYDGDGKGDLAVSSGGKFFIYPGKLNYTGNTMCGDSRVTKDGFVDIPYGLSDSGELEFETSDPLAISTRTDFLGGSRWRRFTVTEDGGVFTNGVYMAADRERWVSSLMADMDGDSVTDVVTLSKQVKGYPSATGVFDKDAIKIRIYYGPYAKFVVEPRDAARYTEITLPGTDAVVPLVLNALADMNGDNKPDIVLTSGDQTMIFEQASDGGFASDSSPAQRIANSDRRAVVADMNADGLNDLIVCRAPEGKVVVLLNKNGKIDPADAAQAGESIVLPEPHSIAVADMNGDEWNDLVAVADRGIYVLLNTTGNSGKDEVAFKSKRKKDGKRPSHIGGDVPELPTEEKANMMMMPYYTGSVYPTPQEAEYRDEFVSLDDAGILVGSDVEKPGPIVDVLTQRINRYGGQASLESAFNKAHKTWISLGDTSLSKRVNDIPPVPDKPEGYVVTHRKIDNVDVIVLKGHERLGLLWSVSSFGQLVRKSEDGTSARVAEIIDYPVSGRRGYLDGGHFQQYDSPERAALYDVYFRFNAPVYKQVAYNYLIVEHPYMSWRDPLNRPPVQAEHIRKLGELLTPLGIEWYGGYHPVKGPYEYKLSGAPEDIDILVKYAYDIAAAGGNFYIQFDDFRFWLNPYDEKAFGTARRADMHIFSELLNRLHAKYPKAGFCFCPPFYWGPKGGVAKWYGEDRDEYLRAAGEELPKNVGIHWTGTRVRSAGATREDLDWITERIKRKPVFWQNWGGVGYRNVSDPIPEWSEWLSRDFLERVDGYYLNSQDYLIAATIADYCWNPDAYDPAKSIKNAIDKLGGQGAYEKLAEADRLRSCMDKYRWFIMGNANGQYKPCAEVARNIERLEANLKRAESLYKQVFAANPGARFWLPNGGLNFALQYLRKIKADASMQFHVQAESQKRQAEKEIGLLPEKDVFLPACDFLGGGHEFAVSAGKKKRASSVLSGSKPEVTAEFVLPEDFSGEHLRFFLSGKTGGAEKGDSALSELGLDASEIESIISESEDTGKSGINIGVSINGNEIYNGSVPFAKNKWSTHGIEFESELLKSTNTVSVSVLNAPDNLSPKPLVFINYGAIKTSE